MRSLIRLLALAVVLALTYMGVMAQPDPLVGTWKLNVTKSRVTPGPPPKALTLVYELAGQGLRATITVVNSDGSQRTSHYTAMGVSP